MPEPTPVKLTLHADAVIAPALRATRQSIDMFNFYMQSLETADLSKPAKFESSRIQFSFPDENISPEERKARYTIWVLAKGFQDFARGIRGALEEAYFYIFITDFLVQIGSRTTTWETLQDKIQEYRKQAEAKTFPDLMTDVNRGLTSPLHFEREFWSLQKVRNCLEHRDGIVGERDIENGTNSLKLSLPRLKMYVEEDGKEIEVGKGYFAKKDTRIFIKSTLHDWEFKLGERVSFKPEDFHDIGYGCWAIASSLASKLPQITSSEAGIATTTPIQQLRPADVGLVAHKSDTKKASNKLKARLPRGFADRDAAEIAATRHMVEKIRAVYERYGFEPMETPDIEYTDALGKFLPDQDRPNEGVFSFQDDDEQWMSLRYDLTAPLARYVAENSHNLALPYRSYRFGWVFRNEKPGPGRFRQFMQFDADTVGSASPAADAEICMMAADTMERLGIARGDYVVKVNSRKVLDGVMETIELGGEENTGRRLIVLRAIDKMDRLGVEGVRQLLGKGRKDESGDFTKGAGLEEWQSSTLLSFLDSKATNAGWTLGKMAAVLENSAIGMKGVEELSQILEVYSACGYDDGTINEGVDRSRITIDPSVVRGLEYYTGPVYEVELLIETKDEKGRPVRFGSVGGGGRYDGLVSRFRGEPVPATGFSIGVSRLQAALTLIGKLDTKPEAGPVVVTVFDKDRVADYQKLVATLRNANIRAELYLGNPKNNVGQQLKYADKRNSPCAIIQGGDELNDPSGAQVIVKDLFLGAELSKLEKDRADHLQRQGEAQQKVPQGKLVDAVRAVLARHGLK